MILRKPSLVMICDSKKDHGMDSSPKQPEKKREERQGVLIASRWLREQIFAPQEEPTISSLGEFLLPILLGIMESCWLVAILIGLANTGLFGSTEPLMPLWAPFAFIVGTILLFYYLGRRATKRASSQEKEGIRFVPSDTFLFIIITAILSLFFVWLGVYSQTAFIFDPKWLLSLLSDALFLNPHFYESAIIIGISFLFGWRGIRLFNRDIEPSNVFRTLCLGLGVIIVVILLRAGQVSAGVVFHDDAILLFLIPFFLFVSLATHALSRVAFIRHSHPAGLQGNIRVQERAIIMVIASLGLIFLLVAILVSSTVNPSFIQALAPVGVAIARAYDWLVGIVADLAVIIATPFFWLLYLFTRLFPPKSNSNTSQGQPPKPPKLPNHPVPEAGALVPFVKIILPVLLLLLIFFLIWWALRRRRRVRVRAQQQKEDLHESLWSWPLFWSQLKAMLRSLFARLFPRAATAEDDRAAPAEQIQGEPAARSMREIYRAFLKKAANRGYSRRRHETPYEFKQRIDEKVSLVEPQLEVITEAYALTRYGASAPDEAQLEVVRNNWVELDQKWV
jgi:Domain of unknown function (DUF4129)